MAWGEKMADLHADLRKDIEAGRQIPYLSPTIDANMKESHRLMVLAVKYGVAEAAVKAAESCLRTVRDIAPLFRHLGQVMRYVVMHDDEDDGINRHLAALADPGLTDDQALRILLHTKNYSLQQLADFLVRHEGQAKAAGLKPLHCRLGSRKFVALQKNIAESA